MVRVDVTGYLTSASLFQRQPICRGATFETHPESRVLEFSAIGAVLTN